MVEEDQGEHEGPAHQKAKAADVIRTGPKTETELQQLLLQRWERIAERIA